MGTASTMAAIVEALGLALPDNATIPAVDARRKWLMARMVGRSHRRHGPRGRDHGQDHDPRGDRERGPRQRRDRRLDQRG